MSHILLIGLGDLGRNITLSLLGRSEISRLTLTARSGAEGRSFAEICDRCGNGRVEFRHLDALDDASCRGAIRATSPDMIVHSAVALSPWAVAASESPAACEIRSIGFGIQLPFQLVLVSRVARAAYDVGFNGPIINCSYPDVTNAVLARVGLSVTAGVGNVSMLWANIAGHLKAEGVTKTVRVIAQHVHTRGGIIGDPTGIPAQLRPWVFIGDDPPVKSDRLAYDCSPMLWGQQTNILAASVASKLICALLSGSTGIRMSIPGPFGLIGGYPVVIGNGQIALDLPLSVSHDEAEKLNAWGAQLEGIEAISDDGIAFFSDHAAQVLSTFDRRLAEPIRLQDVDARARMLAGAMGLRSKLSI